MPKIVHATPKYRHHKASGQAAVTICGKHHYLGRWKSKASRAEYDRLVGEWIAAGRPARLPTPTNNGIFIVELCQAYLNYAEKHYVKDGKATGTIFGIKAALRMLRERHSRVRVPDFGPLALEALQQQMAEAGHARSYVNQNIGRIKRVFRWGVSREIVPVAVYHALLTVPGLRKGRSKARETKKVRPVAAELVERTLPYLPPMLADMVRLQRLLGCRPTEVCLIRPCDVDRSGEVWTYEPGSHKTEHHDKDRIIFIGPRARAILERYLLRAGGDDVYCFSPRESERLRSAERRENRKSPLTPSQAKRQPKRNGKRRPGERYNKNSYNKAIRRACEAEAENRRQKAIEAGAAAEELAAIKPDYWHPYQLRHAAATEIRKRYKLEGSQVILGHSRMNMTEHYAEKSAELAEKIVSEVG